MVVANEVIGLHIRFLPEEVIIKSSPPVSEDQLRRFQLALREELKATKVSGLLVLETRSDQQYRECHELLAAKGFVPEQVRVPTAQY